MSCDFLFAHFDRVGGSPDFVPRMRRLIRDLAVHGKLVPQNANDEPASESLERISITKDRMLNMGEIKVRKIRARNRAYRTEFVLPPGWVFSQLGEIATKITDGTHKTPTYVNAGIPFVSVKDFSAGALDLSNTRFITSEEHQVLYRRCDPRRGDLLLARIGTLGRAVLVDTDAQFSLFVSVGLIRFDHKYTDPQYLAIALNSPFVEGEFDRIKIGGGTHTSKLNLGDLHTVGLPLPPLAEQRRIVAKVDELMALCNRVEAVRTEREKMRDRLSMACFARLTASDVDPSNFGEIAAFVIDNIATLTTRADQIGALRQAILDLAVRGKIVRQEPVDEPVETLLKRISKEKDRMINQGYIRRPREYRGTDDVAHNFPIPSCWQWVRLDAIGAVVGGGTPPAGDSDNFALTGTGVPWLTPSDLRGRSGLFISRGARDLSDKGLQCSSATRMPAGAVLFTSRAPIGYVAIAANPISTNQGFKSVVPYIGDSSEFLAISLMAFAPIIDAQASGTTFREVSGKRMAEIPLPLPPVAEQHRIVAEVHRLMALCDSLERRLASAEDLRRDLLDASLGDALAPFASNGPAKRSIALRGVDPHG